MFCDQSPQWVSVTAAVGSVFTPLNWLLPPHGRRSSPVIGVSPSVQMPLPPVTTESTLFVPLLFHWATRKH